jgi:hypothetical protein
MKCKGCLDYVGNICQKAQMGKLSELEGDCLLRCIAILLRDIWGELSFQNNCEDEGEDWSV